MGSSGSHIYTGDQISFDTLSTYVYSILKLSTYMLNPTVQRA